MGYKIRLVMRVGFYLSTVQIKRLIKLSDKTAISVSEHIRRAIDELVTSGAIRFRALLELGAASCIPFIAKITWDE